MKEYLGGKVKLKEPTLGLMCDVGEIIQIYNLPSMLAGKGLRELFKIICEGDIDSLLKSDPSISEEILRDFFKCWKPLKWISSNTAILQKSKKSSQKLQETSKDIEKP